jgi:putative transcriptional regulator
MEFLKDLRIKNNYTYQYMANLLNISKAFYWQIENNKRTLTYKMAIKIASIFNKKPDDIFYNDLKDKA